MPWVGTSLGFQLFYHPYDSLFSTASHTAPAPAENVLLPPDFCLPVYTSFFLKTIHDLPMASPSSPIQELFILAKFSSLFFSHTQLVMAAQSSRF